MIHIHFSSVGSLPEAVISSQGLVSEAFLHRGVTTFQQAAYYVKNLPYGYNNSADDAMIIFEDGFGTCLTKHGLVARLAKELDLSVYRCEGIYPLTDKIVSGVDEILAEYGLPFIPRVHCFLFYQDNYIDLTEGNCNGKNGLVEYYLEIFRVEPEQIESERYEFYRRYYSTICLENPVFARVGVDGMLETLKRCEAKNASLCPVIL
jgi:hypothetical protein